MTLQQKAKLISDQLKKEYPTVETPLNHKNVFELLVATILSPQTTDITTNTVTPAVFAKYPTPEALADADLTELEPLLKRVNYYKTKALNLIRAAKMLVYDFDSKVPHTLTDLIKLPGVGRKVGNVIISEWYSQPAINVTSNEPHPDPPSTPLRVTQKERERFSDNFSSAARGSILPEGFVIDTHVLRLSKRLGLTKNTDPKKVEQDLMKIFPRSEWNSMSLRLIFHGRNTCTARNHKCSEHEFWKDFCKGE